MSTLAKGWPRLTKTRLKNRVTKSAQTSMARRLLRRLGEESGKWKPRTEP
jgi:hypothetical protein